MTLTRHIVRLFTHTHTCSSGWFHSTHTYCPYVSSASVHKTNIIAIGVSKHPSTHKTNVAIEVSEVLLHLSGSDLM